MGKRRNIHNWNKIIIVIMIALSIIGSLYSSYEDTIPKDGDLNYLEFKDLIKQGKVEKVVQVKGEDTITVHTKDGKELSVINASYDEFRKDLLEMGVELQAQKLTKQDAITSSLSTIILMILLGTLLFFITSQVGITTQNHFQLIRDGGNITFKDIAGMDNIKSEVQTAIETLVNADKIKKTGARPVKGILLDGKPGTGKTLIAKAIAGEAKVPFISCSGSDFVEMFVGLGATRVRALWKLAEMNAPCVIFIDEIDALGKTRSNKSNGDSEQSRTLNALLQRMDGLKVNSGILVIGATNLPDTLDSALLRSGRFDKRIHVSDTYTKEARKSIIEIHIRNKRLEDSLTTDQIASLTLGLTGADIENVVNDAVLISLSNNRDGIISYKDIEQAITKLRVSGVLTGNTYTSKDKEIVAVHESGHALISHLLNRKVSKITIQQYTSGIGGMTVTDPEEENQFQTKEQYEGDIQMLLGGLTAEEIIYGTHTPGCSNDLERATDIAYKMLFSWGMTDKLSSIPQGEIITKEMKEEIDTFLKRQKEHTKSMLVSHKEDLIKIYTQLQDKEILYRKEFIGLLNQIST